MKYLQVVSRVLLGLMFTFFGLNGLLHFLPTPPMPASPAGEFAGLLMTTHYMVAVSLLQLVSGVLFLWGRYVPLALTLIGPVIVNILLYHALMAPASIGPGLLATVLWFVVFSPRRQAFSGIFEP